MQRQTVYPGQEVLETDRLLDRLEARDELYNAKFEALNEKVDALDSRVTTMDAKVDKIGGDIGYIRGALGTVAWTQGPGSAKPAPTPTHAIGPGLWSLIVTAIVIICGVIGWLGNRVVDDLQDGRMSAAHVQTIDPSALALRGK